MTTPQTILIADDNYATQKLLCTILSKEGYTVLGASNGIEVLTQLSQQNIHLIIMDCNMPQMNGLEATQKIRSDMANTETIIVGSTSHTKNIDLETCHKMGMDDFIEKPVTREALLLCIKKWAA
ncbi:MAG: response regulator [Fibrobacterales bacterium]